LLFGTGFDVAAVAGIAVVIAALVSVEGPVLATCNLVFILESTVYVVVSCATKTAFDPAEIATPPPPTM
jgi:hypothetical protein